MDGPQRIGIPKNVAAGEENDDEDEDENDCKGTYIALSTYPFFGGSLQLVDTSDTMQRLSSEP